MELTLETLPCDLTVCKLADVRDADLGVGFFFLARTDGEISLVCRTEDVPPDAAVREDGWRGFRVRGPLDFSLIGILSKLAGILADKGISIFAVSTYDTDYVLVRSESFARAARALAEAGCRVV